MIDDGGSLEPKESNDQTLQVFNLLIAILGSPISRGFKKRLDRHLVRMT